MNYYAKQTQFYPPLRLAGKPNLVHLRRIQKGYLTALRDHLRTPLPKIRIFSNIFKRFQKELARLVEESAYLVEKPAYLIDFSLTQTAHINSLNSRNPAPLAFIFTLESLSESPPCNPWLKNICKKSLFLV